MEHDELKALREALPMSQQKMADVLDYSKRNYQMMETGETPIRNSVALACAAMAQGINAYDHDAAIKALKKRK